MSGRRRGSGLRRQRDGEPDFGERFVKTALDAFDGIDIIVNNAGFTWDSVIQKMTDEQFQAVMDVHVTAPFRILRAAAEPIRRFAKKEAEEGQEVFRKVVNISSVSGLGGNAGQINYAAAKAGIVGMTKTLAQGMGTLSRQRELRRVRLHSDADDAAASADKRAGVTLPDARSNMACSPRCSSHSRRTNPARTTRHPEEAADGVYLFCSPESNYISGQVITVGGGVNF